MDEITPEYSFYVPKGVFLENEGGMQVDPTATVYELMRAAVFFENAIENRCMWASGRSPTHGESIDMTGITPFTLEEMALANSEIEPLQEMSTAIQNALGGN